MRADWDEKNLDSYVESLAKKEIEVPKELEAKILDRIERVALKRMDYLKSTAKNLLASVAILLLLFVTLVKWVPGFAAYASGIPIVKYAVEWIQGDSGTERAKQEGYPVLGPVIVEQNDYKLVIDNIMFDEDRLVMSVHAYGAKIEELLPVKETGTPYDDPRDKPSPHIKLQFLDFKDNGYVGFYYPPLDSNNKAYEIKVEQIFNDGQVKAFLATNPEYLSLSAEIAIVMPNQEKQRAEQVLETFENIKIPLDTDKITLSKKVEPNITVALDQTVLTVDRLTISPTRMRVDVSFQLPDGYFFTDFENPYLKDSNGNIYKGEGLTSTHSSEAARRLFFVPSTYFDNSHKKLYFGFDGIRIGAEEGTSFTISLQDTYPKTISYMGEEILIEEVIYDANSFEPLQVTMLVPKTLKIQGLKVQGATSYFFSIRDTGDDSGNPVTVISGATVDYSTEYEVEFNLPGYLINIPKELPIVLK